MSWLSVFKIVMAIAKYLFLPNVIGIPGLDIPLKTVSSQSSLKYCPLT